MLDILARVEIDLPALLVDTDSWNTLDINYHTPFVERLWRPYGPHHRVALHRIHPCAASYALFHRHPWPSAMRVLEGTYEMAIGYGWSPPPIAARIIADAGFAYEMTEPDAWHYVRPIGGPAMTIMVTGRPWPATAPGNREPLQPLDDQTRDKIFDWFRERYPVR